MNMKTLCLYSQYKTIKLNHRYFSLLYTKIHNLKQLKNKVIKLKSMYENNNKEDNKQLNLKELYNIFNQTEFKLLIDLYRIDLLKIGNTENKLLSLKQTITQINKSIKQHIKNQKYKIPYFKFNIVDYDLYKLNQHQTTLNINVVIKSYLHSKTAKQKKLFKDYENKHLMNIAFNKHLTKILNSFENKFLYRTL